MNAPAPDYARLPLRGPHRYTVAGISRVLVGAGLTIGPVLFKFPKDIFVSAIQICARSGSPVDHARLELRVLDTHGADLVTDLVPGGSRAIPALLLGGLAAPKAFPVQRPAKSGDEWRFSVTNTGVAGITVAALALWLEEAT